MKQNQKTVLIVLAVIFILSIILFLFPYHYLAPFQGKVIDADTKEPIGGAVVLAVYHKSTTSIAGSDTYPVDAQESMTDADGEFRMSAKRVWFGKIEGWPRGNITIFKPGYGVFADHIRSRAVGINKSWPPLGNTFCMKFPS